MRVAYGIDIKTHDDPYVEIGEKSLQALSAATSAGSYLVDALPFRKFLHIPFTTWRWTHSMIFTVKYIPSWFPGATFQIQAKEWRPWVTGMLNDPFEYVKKSIVSDILDYRVTSSHSDPHSRLTELLMNVLPLACLSACPTMIRNYTWNLLYALH